MIGISTVAIIPLRSNSSEQSEMVSQLLWGELFEVEQQKNNWIQVRTMIDGYLGWLNPLITSFIMRSDLDQSLLIASARILNVPLAYARHLKTGERILLPQGSLLYNYNEKNGKFNLLNEEYQVENLLPTPFSLSPGNIIEGALNLINAPYLWGGRNAMGIDCSGFTQLIYRCAGLILPRDAKDQLHHGTLVDFVEVSQPADLAFFDNEVGDITHVGVLLGDDKIIHASGNVHIDRIDNEGIFSQKHNRYTHKLRAIKRLI
ncbi:MAG: NlpC/P60 family protein [Bacteroidales bacterium]